MKSHLELIPTKDMNRETWLQYRYSGIGASEVGTILGLDDYTSSLELYYQKIGDVSRLDIETMAAFMGREQEDLIARLWQYWDGDECGMIDNFRKQQIVRKCRRINAYVRNPKFPWLFVSLDRIINKIDDRGEGSLELKTISGWEADKWEAGLPPKYVTQVQTQLGVCEFLWGEMAVLQDGRRMEVLPFDPHEGVWSTIVERTKEFWDRVVAGRRLVNEKFHAASQFNQKRILELNHEIDQLAPEPDGTLVYAQYLSQRHKEPNKLERRGTPEELLIAQEHLQIGQQIADLKENYLLKENQLKAVMTEYQALDFGNDGRVTWAIGSSGGRYFRNRVKV